MKASFYTRYGSPDVLSIKEIDTPVPKDDEVLVRVHNTTVSRTDCANISAKPLIMRFFIGFFEPKKQTPGTDFAGEVVAVGKGVSSFKQGDRVFGFDDAIVSSQAEYCTISEHGKLMLIPVETSFEKAIACCEAFHYAYTMVSKGGLQPGQHVLVNGGTGAIGSALIQIAKAHGATVTAVCGTPHLKRIKALGADEVVDYLTEDFTQLDDRFDYVCDAVGKSSFTACKKLLKPKGIYISSELGWMLSNIFFAITTPWFKGKRVLFPIPDDVKKSLAHACLLLEKEQFDPLIDRHYPLSDIAEAYRYVGKGQKIGNVILDVC